VTFRDVVVIGAGVIGASCAFHLARAGLRVTVIDRAAGPDGGSTARATGGFRASFATPINVALSKLSRARLRAFRAETGVDPGFVAVGYLWLATSEADLAALRDALRSAIRIDDIRDINCAFALDGIAGALWCPNDGVLRPTEIQRGYLEAAARHGATVRWHEPALALDRVNDRITTVVTPRGPIEADLVINAAGAWAAPLARLAGVDVPVVPLRRQVAVTVPTNALPDTLPLTIWSGDGFHVRVRDGRALLLRPDAGDPADPWNDRVDPGWLDAITRVAAKRIPALAGVPIDRERSWAGFYEMSPDHHALLGFAPGCANLLLVNGSSGHGVMHAPALGLLASEIAIHGAGRSLDVRALRPSRFADGEPIRGPSLL
jgi:sarcosine oxidase subunit beta